MLAAFLFTTTLWAAEPASQATDTEIVVIGEYEVKKQLGKLNKELLLMGYRNGKEKGNKIIYVPESSWKPTVIVHRSGLIEIKRTKPRFEPYIGGRKDNKLRWLACIPPFTIMCVKMGGWLVGKRKLQHAKTKVVHNTQPTVESWQQAIQKIAMHQRLKQDLPDILTALWEAPQPPETKHAELLALWTSRTCTPEGEQARKVIEEFMRYEVQISKTPIPDRQIQRTLQENRCKTHQLLDRKRLVK